jgi:hypothetical protein
MKAYWEWMYRSTFFLTLAMLEVSGQLHTPAALPRAKSPMSHWIEGWIDPSFGLEDLEKRKFLTLPGLELLPLGRPGHSQSLYRLRYPGSSQQ